MLKKPTYEELEKKNQELEQSLSNQQQSEKALKEIQERYNSIFNSSTSLIYTYDLKGNFIEANRAALDLFGYTHIEIKNLSFLDILCQEEIPKAQAALKRILSKGIDDKTEDYRIKTKNGDIKYIELKGGLVYKSGQTTAIQGIAIDTTERKKAEIELRNRNKFIETILVNLPVGLAVNRISDNSIIYVNNKFEEIYGWTAADIQSVESFFEKVYPDPTYRKKLQEMVLADIESGDPSRMVWSGLKATSKDGKEKVVTAVNIPLFEQDLMISTVQDISDQHYALQQLKQSEEKFRQLAEMLPEPIYEIDKTGKLTFANKRAYDKFLYTEEDFKQGLNAIDMIVPEDRNRVAENLLLLMNGKDVGLSEYTAIKKDGITFPVLMRSSPIYSGKEICGLRGFMIDMTEQKALENQLVQAQKMESIGTLAGGIAHDFNNILMIMIGSTELAMYDMPKGSPAIENLESVKTAGRRAAELVNQLLSFSRKSEIEKKPINLSTIAKESLKLIRATIPTSIEIKKNIPKNCHTVYADPTQIHQVIINLCTNAYHAMGKGGSLSVSLENIYLDQESGLPDKSMRPGNYVRLTISDTGHGISTENLDKIFDPYFTTKDVDKGTGMGLSVVHGIIKSHEGSITVDSKIGRGTTFSIYLPATIEGAEHIEQEEQTTKLGTENILVIDDDKFIVDITQKILERFGYKVCSKTDPIEALELITSDPDQFDLVITDMTMPKMTGDQLAKEIINIRNDIPIILCTGFSDLIDEEKAQSIGIKAFLMKPMEANILSDTVRKVLDGK